MTNVLIGLVAFLFIVSLVQIVRVSELLSKLNNQDTNVVTERDNQSQGFLFLLMIPLFLGFVVWQMISWNKYILTDASSVHGTTIDGLMDFTMITILILFFVLTPLLFYFAYKYRGRVNNKALFYPENHRLEIAWTIIPAIFLTGLIIYGLRTWDEAMNVDTTDAQIIEVYGQGLGKFGWTARYSGEDNVLGDANYKLFTASNYLGVDTNDIAFHDDMITTEVHLVKDRPVLLKFRSRDVIHSAYLPHFRVQMNCVPGVTTQFGFTPTKTTAEMRKDPKIIEQMRSINNIRKEQGKEKVEFDYVLLCNKICGSQHYNMKMKFVVETEEEYNNWISKQKTLGSKLLTSKK